MATSIKSIGETSNTNDFSWVYQTNEDPWDSSKIAEWAPYPDHISSKIEEAFRHDHKQLFINEMYRIDLVHFIQQSIDDPDRQRPIHRRGSQTNEGSPDEHWHGERLLVPLRLTCVCNVTLDARRQDLPFVNEWLLTFTKGKIKVTFDSIFPVLVHGLEQEGRNEPSSITSEIMQMLNRVRIENLNKGETTKMKHLQECCAKLFTKSCFISLVVNTALRDNDRTKLNTIGPFCYLLYNYIGRNSNNGLSIGHCFRQLIHRTESQSLVVYRGDHISREIIEQYKQAAGNTEKYFKWLPFVATSRDRDVAEIFGHNALYIIKLNRCSSSDQFVILNNKGSSIDDREVLLKPGVRFLVIRVEFDDHFGRYLIYVKVTPSYISNLS